MVTANHWDPVALGTSQRDGTDGSCSKEMVYTKVSPSLARQMFLDPRGKRTGPISWCPLFLQLLLQMIPDMWVDNEGRLFLHFLWPERSCYRCDFPRLPVFHPSWQRCSISVFLHFHVVPPFLPQLCFLALPSPPFALVLFVNYQGHPEYPSV